MTFFGDMIIFVDTKGVIDKDTLTVMRAPRCGNTDKVIVNKAGNLGSLWPIGDGPNFQSSFPLSSVPSNSLHNQRKRRKRRYALQGSKWRRQELTYRISQYPTRFNGRRHEVDAQIDKAFSIWSRVAPIDFVVKREGKVHIDIRFASGEHGDGDAFDGPGNTLAHAYFPQYGGDAHFDDQEFWTIDSYAGTNIFQVAAHELGHSLGLGHSNVREALMAPFYQKYKPNFKLHLDDILAIQALYGEKSFLPDDDVPVHLSPPKSSDNDQSSITRSPLPAPITTSTSATTIQSGPTTTTQRPFKTHHVTQQPRPMLGGRPTFFGIPRADDGEKNEDESPPFPDLSTNGINVNSFGDDSVGFQGAASTPHQPQPQTPVDLCTESAIDAATRTEDGSSYVFKGEYYWLLSSEGLVKGYPRRITADWDGLTGPIDAALTWADGKTFFFKGNKYWRYKNKRRDIGYPKLISAGFAGIPDDIDTAIVWSGNGRTYFFKGTEYWRFDSKADPPVSNEYPRSIKVWNGVPSYLDAAFKWENNVTYFFKGKHYYRFNDREFKVEPRGRPPFPRLTAEWWFGCIGSNLAQRALPDLEHHESVVRTSIPSLSQTPFEPSNSKSSGLSIDSSREWSLLPMNSNNHSINHGLGTHVNDKSPAKDDESSVTNHIFDWDSTQPSDSSPNHWNAQPGRSQILGRGPRGSFASSSAITSLAIYTCPYNLFLCLTTLVLAFRNVHLEQIIHLKLQK